MNVLLTSNVPPKDGWVKNFTLYEVEGLSHRQIAHQLGLSRKKAARLLRGQGVQKRASGSIVAPYGRLIAEWY